MSTTQATPVKIPAIEWVVRGGLLVWSLVGLVAFLVGYRQSAAWTVWGLVEIALLVVFLALGVRKWRNP